MAFFGDLISGGGVSGSSAVGKIGTALLNKLVSGSLIIIFIIILSAVIVGVALYVRYLRQFVYKVEIKSLRSSGIVGQSGYKIIEDKAAIIRNKRDKSVWFRLKNQMVDLPMPPLECIQMGIGGVNHVKILQKSDEEYYYLLPDKIDMLNVIRNGQEISLGSESIKVVDGDVAYWNLQKKKENKKLFDVESMIMKLLPYIVPVLMFMLVIFMTYFITNHWGEFAAAAQALERAANALSGTTTATVTG